MRCVGMSRVNREEEGSLEDLVGAILGKEGTLVWAVLRGRGGASTEEAVPESVDDRRHVEEEAENDVYHDVDVAVVAVDEDRQRRQENAEDKLDDLLHFDRHALWYCFFR